MLNRHILTLILAALTFSVSQVATHPAPSQNSDPAAQLPSSSSSDDRVLSAALCPIVYQVDRSPSPRGYRYLFYGNAFFINREGYLLTVAHVLTQLHGGQPYLLLHSPGAQPRFVQAAVVAIDRDHDIAVLRATPNPFDSDFTVSFLPLAPESVQQGRAVLAAALRPFRPRDCYTQEAIFQERSPGEVLNFEFSQLEKGRPDTQLFLFSHAVQPGQSGAPVISPDSQKVLGLIEGQWLREDTLAIAAPNNSSNLGGPLSSSANVNVPVPGAVIPVHYAISLLQQKGIAWHSTSDDSPLQGEASAGNELSSPPVPLSLIPAPYPPQSLFGGEVLLDALVGRTGILSDIKVVRGEHPFLENTLAAVRTWTFLPAHSMGRAVESRIAIAFQFPQPYIPPRSPTAHHYDEDLSIAAGDRAAIPLATVEPEYPSANAADGSVMLYESLDALGQITSVHVLRELDPFTSATLASSRQWHFSPARQSGVAVESAAVIVIIFRRPLVTSRSPH